MKQKDVNERIAAAISLSQEIIRLQEDLEKLKSIFRAMAEHELADQGIKELPGNSYTFVSEAGPIARVTFPSPGLVREIWFIKEQAFHRVEGPNGKRIDKPLGLALREVCGLSFSKLFATSYKPAKAFRELAPALLRSDTAAKVVGACTVPPGSPRVSFEVKNAAPDPSA